MICPKCGAEYQEGFTECSDCHAELVDAGTQEAADSELLPSIEKTAFPRLSNHIDKWLKIGGITIAVLGVIQAVIGLIPSGYPAGMNGGPGASQILTSLVRIPEQLVTGLVYFGLGELLLLLRKFVDRVDGGVRE